MLGAGTSIGQEVSLLEVKFDLENVRNYGDGSNKNKTVALQQLIKDGLGKNKEEGLAPFTAAIQMRLVSFFIIDIFSI